MEIAIKNRWNNLEIFKCEAGSLREVLEKAAITGADLTDADLTGANLTDADLTGANLMGANLTGANLMGANLTGANLTGANLMGANLTGANLMDAKKYLRSVQVDFFDVLLRASTNGEVPGLIAAIKEGRIDGSTYEGECACLVGTIANVKHVRYTDIVDLSPDSSRPIERFFLGIRKGDTPETNQVSRIVLEWAEEFQRLMSRVKIPANFS